MVYNYPQDSSRSPIPLYRAYSGESASKKSRDVIKAFVDQTNQSSLRKILISQKRSENMKMGKSFTHRIKRSAHSAQEKEQVSLVVAGGSVAAAAQPPLQPEVIQYKRAHTSTLATSSASAGSQPSHHHPKPTSSTSFMDTIHAGQGPNLPQVEKIRPSTKVTSTPSAVSQARKKSDEGFYAMGEKMGAVLLESRSFIYSDIPEAVEALKESLVKGGEALFDIDDLLVDGGSIEDPEQLKTMVDYVRLVHDILLQASKSPSAAGLPVRRLMWISPGGRLTTGLKALENALLEKGESEKTKGSEGKRPLDTTVDQIATTHQESILPGSAPPIKKQKSAHSNDFPESEVFDNMTMDPKETPPHIEDKKMSTTEVAQGKTPSEASFPESGNAETLEARVERDLQLLMKKASNFIDPADVESDDEGRVPEGRWPRGVDDQFLLGPIIPRSEEYLAIGTIPFSDTTATTFVKSCGPPTVGKKKDKKTTDNGFSEESQQRHFGVTAQAFTKCRRHAKDEALMEDPLRPGKKIPWTYVDPTSDYSFRFLTWARFAGKLHARKLMVKPEWDFKGGESMEVAIERFKTEAIPEFLNRIVKEAKTDHFMITHILSVYARKFFWTYFTEECKKARKACESE